LFIFSTHAVDTYYYFNYAFTIRLKTQEDEMKTFIQEQNEREAERLRPLLDAEIRYVSAAGDCSIDNPRDGTVESTVISPTKASIDGSDWKFSKEE